jgi:hypothetical protein
MYPENDFEDAFAAKIKAKASDRRRKMFRPLPKIRCEAVDSAYFGYGATEHLECRRPATHRARYVEPDFDAHQRGVAHPGHVSGKLLLCASHAHRHVPDSGPYGSVGPAYRFRRVTS